MERAYIAPDFDVTLYDVEDVLTVSVGTHDLDGGSEGWMEIE